MTLKTMALLCLILLCVLPVRSEPSLCDVFDKYATGRRVEFDGAAYAFEDMPADLEPLAYLPLNDPTWIPATEEQAYVLFISPSTGKIYVFLYWSMEARADEDGEHYGNHDFCYPAKVIETRE